MTDPALFALTVLAILATPGPTNTLLAIGGAAAGLRRAWPLVVAEAAGYGIAITAIGLVARPAVARDPRIALALRVLVSGYLLYLAARLARRAAARADAAGVVTAARVFVTTLLNPKAVVFALGVIPFETARAGRYLLGFVAILVPVSITWIAAGAALGRAAAGAGRERWIARAGAGMLAVFAAALLVSVAANLPSWKGDWQ